MTLLIDIESCTTRKKLLFVIFSFFMLLIFIKIGKENYPFYYTNIVVKDNDFNNSDFQFKISYIHHLILNKNVSCSSIIDYFLERAYTFNPKLNAIIAFNPRAKAQAIALDIAFANKNKKYLVGELHCIPTLVKDNIDVVGMATSGGIRAFRNSRPLRDSVVVERLRAAGAIVLGKANMVELAVGVVETSEMGGLCHNPFDLTRTCSGSSSGSAAGIAGGLAIIGLGTDTAFSILSPSSFAGLFGLRPPIGGDNRSGGGGGLMMGPPLDGILPLFLRSDTVGPMVKNLDDLVLVYSVMNADPSIYKRCVNCCGCFLYCLGLNKVICLI